MLGFAPLNPIVCVYAKVFRTFINRPPRQFPIPQVTLIPTWLAKSAGTAQPRRIHFVLDGRHFESCTTSLRFDICEHIIALLPLKLAPLRPNTPREEPHSDLSINLALYFIHGEYFIYRTHSKPMLASTLLTVSNTKPEHHDISTNSRVLTASNLEISLIVQSLNFLGWLRKGAWPLTKFSTSH